MSLSLESLIASARRQGASDLHLEAALPPALRIRGSLRTAGDPTTAQELAALAQELIGSEQWPRLPPAECSTRTASRWIQPRHSSRKINED